MRHTPCYTNRHNKHPASNCIPQDGEEERVACGEIPFEFCKSSTEVPYGMRWSGNIGLRSRWVIGRTITPMSVANRFANSVGWDRGGWRTGRFPFANSVRWEAVRSSEAGCDEVAPCYTIKQRLPTDTTNTPLQTVFPRMAKKNALPAVKVQELSSEDLTKRKPYP